MNSGLDITEEQFMKLTAKERDLMIFRNMLHIRKKVSNYRFHTKLMYGWLSLLSVLAGFKRILLI